MLFSSPPLGPSTRTASSAFTRRSFRLPVACLALLGASYGTQACTDDDPSPSPATVVDGGGLDGPATSEAGADGPALVDASTDAPIVDRGPVTVEVVSSTNAPVAGVKVVFYDGATVTVATTGSDGRATQEMTAGGHVTVADAQDGARRLTTVMHVEPSDVLRVLGGPPGGAPPDDYATITFNTVQPFAGAASTDLTAGCSSTSLATGPVPPITVTARCVKGDKVPILGIARNGANQIIAYAVKEATVTDGGTSNVNVLTADWVAAPPAGASSFAGTEPPFLLFAEHSVSFFKNGQSYLSTLETPASGAFTSIPYSRPPASFADFLRSYTRLGFYSGADGGSVGTLQPVTVLIAQEALAGDAGAATVSRSFDDLFPRIHSASLQSTGGTQALSWISSAPVPAIGGYLYMTGSLTIDGSIESFEWYATFPSGSAVTLPALPPSLSAFSPTDPLRVEFFGLVDTLPSSTYKDFRSSASRYRYLQDVDDTDGVPGDFAGRVRVTGMRFVN